MIQFNKDILIPVDFNQPSINAIQMAVKMIPLIKGRIHLFHVIETGGIIMDLLESKSGVVDQTTFTMQKLDSLKDNYLKSVEVEVILKVEVGKPSRKILEYAASIDPSIILIGDNDQFVEGSKVLGSTNTFIITHSRWPVVTLKSRMPDSFRKIILPVDLSFQSRSQLCNAIALAKHYKPVIYLVSVLMGGIKMKHSRIYNILREIQNTFRQNGVNSEIKLYDRSEVTVYERILDYASETDADLIMIMTHQEGTTHDNYIGAVAHHVINEAPMPVLSLTHKAAMIGKDESLTIVDPLNILSKSIKARPKMGFLRRLLPVF